MLFALQDVSSLSLTLSLAMLLFFPLWRTRVHQRGGEGGWKLHEPKKTFLLSFLPGECQIISLYIIFSWIFSNCCCMTCSIWRISLSRTNQTHARNCLTSHKTTFPCCLRNAYTTRSTESNSLLIPPQPQHGGVDARETTTTMNLKGTLAKSEWNCCWAMKLKKRARHDWN